MSKVLCPKNQALSVYEREFLAVLMAVQKWKHYLQGQKFIIKTDQQALKHLLDQKIVTPVQQKWITKLLGFEFEIHYKKGKENGAADALSRRGDDELIVAAVTTVTPSWISQVLQSYQNDEFIQKILSSKAISPDSYADFQKLEDVLRYRKRVVVGSSGGIRELILA